MRWAKLYLGLRRIYLRIKHDPQRFQYMDLALTPVTDDEVETHELFRSQAAQAYVGQEQHLDKFRRTLGSPGARGGRARASLGRRLTRPAPERRAQDEGDGRERAEPSRRNAGRSAAA